MLLEELAEDLVSATSGLLDGRIINIMNPDGIIIASTQPERIGTFHKGARDAAVSGKPVSIRPDQIQEYSGAREAEISSAWWVSTGNRPRSVILPIWWRSTPKNIISWKR